MQIRNKSLFVLIVFSVFLMAATVGLQVNYAFHKNEKTVTVVTLHENSVSQKQMDEGKREVAPVAEPDPAMEISHNVLASSASITEIKEEVPVVVDPVVYDNMTMAQLSEKLERNLNSSLVGKGSLFATYSLSLGIDPYLALAIVLHETGCKWNCSTLVTACNNVGGQKGSPSCNGGSYAAFPTLDDGIRSYLDNLNRNYYAKGLTTPELIGPRYTGQPTYQTWVNKINYYIDTIRNS